MANSGHPPGLVGQRQVGVFCCVLLCELVLRCVVSRGIRVAAGAQMHCSCIKTSG